MAITLNDWYLYLYKRDVKSYYTNLMAVADESILHILEQDLFHPCGIKYYKNTFIKNCQQNYAQMLFQERYGFPYTTIQSRPATCIWKGKEVRKYKEMYRGIKTKIKAYSIKELLTLVSEMSWYKAIIGYYQERLEVLGEQECPVTMVRTLYSGLVYCYLLYERTAHKVDLRQTFQKSFMETQSSYIERNRRIQEWLESKVKECEEQGLCVVELQPLNYPQLTL